MIALFTWFSPTMDKSMKMVQLKLKMKNGNKTQEFPRKSTKRRLEKQLLLRKLSARRAKYQSQS
jgi:hypothetical protein